MNRQTLERKMDFTNTLTPRFRQRKKQKRPELTEDQKAEVKEAFDLNEGNYIFFDLSIINWGFCEIVICANGFKVAMKALGHDIKKAEILEIKQQYDKEDTGTIAYQDFLEISYFNNVILCCFAYVLFIIFDLTRTVFAFDSDTKIYKAFQLFDDDQTGKISLKNLRRVARELGENMSDEDLQGMIDEFDKDEDNEISLEEFAAIMKQSSLY
ncbi:centrin [Reticulomyxa filosa]|uniref:Centrin n=1 Tax=Reticulomyxa filosa TaxID=46433 RepID=X6P854_RETFI|nr:centrin [Reticulomyxa filosa]|eukprot:ETO34720.1 centrin [Reticulomyxa filosa]